jgi:hypothetical protein
VNSFMILDSNILPEFLWIIYSNTGYGKGSVIGSGYTGAGIKSFVAFSCSLADVFIGNTIIYLLPK